MAKCKHCEFLRKTFGSDSHIKKLTPREYWLLTEVFCYLHDDKDYCDGNIKVKIC